MASENHQPPSSNPGDAALYIATLTEELARLATRHDLKTLAYILDIARLEAKQISQRWGELVGEGPSKRQT